MLCADSLVTQAIPAEFVRRWAQCVCLLACPVHQWKPLHYSKTSQQKPHNFSWCAYWIFTLGCFTVMYVKCRMKYCTSNATRGFLIGLSQPKTALLLKSIVLLLILSLCSYYAGLSEMILQEKQVNWISSLTSLPLGLQWGSTGTTEAWGITWRDMT